MSGRDIRDYRDLDVWQTARELAVSIYDLTRQLPKEERFGLVSQMRRAAVSIAANIAEGNGRMHRGEYAHFVSIARGSAAELECLLDITRTLGLVSVQDCAAALELIGRVLRMLFKLYHKLAQNPSH